MTNNKRGKFKIIVGTLIALLAIVAVVCRFRGYGSLTGSYPELLTTDQGTMKCR